ncbi:MAG: hypothetical protein M3429_07850, partial [Verrucomicrobiota bacterium]|nr:hypothetical protein [Verrucomicrobiota bacterium]
MQPSNLPQDTVPSPPATRGGVRVPNEVDATLVRQMSSGDEGAFTTFYDRFAPGLFSMIYAILHDPK